MRHANDHHRCSLWLATTLTLLAWACGGGGDSTPAPAQTTTAPKITPQPKSTTVTVGQTASFSASASGTAPLAYQWSKNGSVIPGATSSSYTTGATVTGDNNASFVLKVTNSKGSDTSNAAILTVTSQSLTDITLPQPRLTDAAHPVPKALSSRMSTRAFSSAELSTLTQAEICWAAFGVNRPSEGNRRTAASSWNDQDIDLYLATSSGAFKYNAFTHSLEQVSSTDIRGLFGAPYQSAPLTIAYVSTHAKISATDKVRYSHIHTGLIAMNVYLYAAYEGLPVVVRSSVPDTLATALGLTSNQAITLVQTIGLPTGQTNASGAAPQAGKLPTPRYTTHPILTALMNRKSASTSGIASTALTPQTLGEVLWCGFGVNRTDGYRTAPSAYNCQDIDIYAATASGVYRYDAPSHTLKAISSTDIRPLISTNFKDAPLSLVYVSDYTRISSAADQERYSSAHTGFIAQNVYVYCASENLATRVYENLADSAGLRTALKLTGDQQVKLAQSVGNQP